MQRKKAEMEAERGKEDVSEEQVHFEMSSSGAHPDIVSLTYLEVRDDFSP